MNFTNYFKNYFTNYFAQVFKRSIHIVPTNKIYKGHRMEIIKGKRRRGGFTYFGNPNDINQFPLLQNKHSDELLPTTSNDNDYTSTSSSENDMLTGSGEGRQVCKNGFENSVEASNSGNTDIENSGIYRRHYENNRLENYVEFKDYKDAWKRTTKKSRKKWGIARIWGNKRKFHPLPEPKSLFVLHDTANSKRFQRKLFSTEFTTATNVRINLKNEQGNAKHSTHEPASCNPEYGKDSTSDRLAVGVGIQQKQIPDNKRMNLIHNFFDPLHCFAVFKSNELQQHKVVIGDIVQIEKLHRRNAGDTVYFSTLLLLGSNDFTWIGKPTVPRVLVKAAVEQQTITRLELSFRYKKSARFSRLMRRNQQVTMIRILDFILDDDSLNEILTDKASGDAADDTTLDNYAHNHKTRLTRASTYRKECVVPIVKEKKVKPPVLLHLWSNRWLNNHEVEGIKGKIDGESDRIYTGPEHTPGFYHKLGIMPSYAFTPDPEAPSNRF